jgi:thymidine kinase
VSLPRGDLTIIVGNMFAGKSSALIKKVRGFETYSRKKFLAFKPDLDNRYGNSVIASHDGDSIPAYNIPVNNPRQALEIIKTSEEITGRKIDRLAFDEVQFYDPESGFREMIDELLESYDIVVAGLAFSFRREPFGSTLLLLELSKNETVQVTWLLSFCAKCGKPAMFPQRFEENGQPSPYHSPLIVVGGKNRYEPRCYRCHELPR